MADVEAPSSRRPKSDEKSKHRKEKPFVNEATRAFTLHIRKNGVEGLQREFAEVSTYQPPNFDFAAFTQNPERNRYNDVVCLDSTRVVLTLESPPQSNYIHANWVKMDGNEHIFIATQGPLESTIEDFWRMVYQENCSMILMLCGVEEGNKSKSAQYWPKEQGSYLNYGVMFVNNKKVENTAGRCITTTLEVLPDGCSNSLITKLTQVTSWPDKGIPKSTAAVCRLLQSIKKFKDPCVIHCSAGIGRTGTIILIDTILMRLLKKQKVDVKEMLKELRSKRASSVQSAEQYLFVYYAVCQYIGLKTNVYMDNICVFAVDYADMVNKKDETNK